MELRVYNQIQGLPLRALADQKNSFIRILHLFYYHFFETFLKYRTLFWSILDIKSSFLPCVCGVFANFGHQFVVFAVVRGIFAELKTVVSTVCGVLWYFLEF